MHGRGGHSGLSARLEEQAVNVGVHVAAGLESRIHLPAFIHLLGETQPHMVPRLRGALALGRCLFVELHLRGLRVCGRCDGPVVGRSPSGW